jgi:catechol 2,3-dioxygenase-like lactoylglutathione lyase family enzyme
MKFRIARHTDSLEKMTAFYVDILGLEVLGSFKDHDEYDGIFLGLPGHDWHLEFTVSPDAPVHTPDDDDLTVFYVTEGEYNIISDRAGANGQQHLTAKNPYWRTNGLTITDPDGYRVVIAKVSK